MLRARSSVGDTSPDAGRRIAPITWHIPGHLTKKLRMPTHNACCDQCHAQRMLYSKLGNRCISQTHLYNVRIFPVNGWWKRCSNTGSQVIAGERVARAMCAAYIVRNTGSGNVPETQCTCTANCMQIIPVNWSRRRQFKKVFIISW